MRRHATDVVAIPGYDPVWARDAVQRILSASLRRQSGQPAAMLIDTPTSTRCGSATPTSNPLASITTYMGPSGELGPYWPATTGWLTADMADQSLSSDGVDPCQGQGLG